MEYLAPADLASAVQARPVAYLPLGSLEFHSAHLPIGLDALNAHGLCVAAAETDGGVVLPAVYQGVGGGHADYPWTVMMTSAAGVRAHLEQTLARLEHFGFRLAVIVTGHFADEQLAMIDEIAADWCAGDRTLRVLATGVNRCGSAPLPPDHAGVFETTLLHSLHPQLVRLDRLPAVTERPAVDPRGDPMGAHRHDPNHVLWGIFGPDPRLFDPRASADLLAALVRWLTESTAAHLTHVPPTVPAHSASSEEKTNP